VATFTGTANTDVANSLDATLIGFAGGTLLELQDTTGDTFTAGAGADTVVAGSGNDTINLANGDFVAGESIDGGAGTDTIVLSNGSSTDYRLGTTVSIENLISGSGVETIDITADQFRGFSFIDTGTGTDTLNVHVSGLFDFSANTIPTLSRVNNVHLFGSDGDETVTLTGAQILAFTRLDFCAGVDSLIIRTSADFSLPGAIQLVGIENRTIVDDDSGHTITGTSGADTIIGNGGNDTINGGGNNDRIIATSGSDGADVYDGGTSNDTVDYSAVSNDLTVTLNGATAATVTVAGGNNDTIVNFEHFIGGSGHDLITGDSLKNQLFGGDGNDTINGGASDDRIIATSGSDGADVYDGGTSNDTADYSAVANDLTVTLNGATAATVTVAGGDNDTIVNIEYFTAGAGNDSITGDSLKNHLLGGDGNDTIDGGANSDTITGGAGADTMIGGAITGTTVDTFVIGSGEFEAGELIDGGGGTDIISLAGIADFSTGTLTRVETLNGSAGNETVTMTAAQLDAFTTVALGDGTDSLTIETADNFVFATSVPATFTGVESIAIEDNNGGHALTGSGQADTFIGNGGNDTINGGLGDDTIDGGGDIDTAVYSGAWLDYTLTGAGPFTIADTRGGSPDGTDTVSNVEQFTFSNGTFTAAQIVNDAPIDITLSASTVAEHATNGTVVGGLSAADADAVLGDTATLTLLDDAGERFAISGNNLVVADGSLLDYATAASHLVIVRVTDAKGLFFDESFTIIINEFDESDQFDVTVPTDTDVAADAVGENVAIGTYVGLTAFASDADPTNNAVSYSLSSNPGGLFAIDGTTGAVTTAAALDRETLGAGVMIQVRADSSDGSFATQSFTITINDVNEAPTNITLTGNAVNELATNGTVIATLGANDPDAGDTITFTLDGDAGGRFQIVGNELKVLNGAALDFEQATNHNITIRATDLLGETVAVDFTIAVNDVNPENATGTAAGEHIMGGLLADTLTGAGGSDTLAGAGGNDTFNLANGDFVTGEAIDGGDGIDTIVLTSATAIVDFTVGTMANVENLTSGAGVDTITMTAAQFVGFSWMHTGEGNDRLNVNVTGTFDFSGNTFPILFPHVNYVVLNGLGDVNVTLTTAQITPQTHGFTSLALTGTNDTVTIKTIGDFIFAPTSSFTSVENIIISDNDSAHSLTGSSRSESFIGNGGNDTINGGSGDDRIIATSGSDGVDAYDGGSGKDTVDYSAVSNDLAVTLNGATTATVTVAGGDNDTIVNIERFTGGSGNDLITGDTLGNRLYGGGGFDTINGLGGDDAIDGDAGNDSIDGGDGNDVITGGAGNDTIDGGSNPDTITGGAGADTMIGGPATGTTADTFVIGSGEFEAGELVDGGGGTDIISLAGTADFSTGTLTRVETLNGSAGNETVTMTAAQLDAFTTIALGDGTDLLTIETTDNFVFAASAPATFTGVESIAIEDNDGAHALTGSGQADTIIGNGGNDTINGGLGDDIFVFNAGFGQDTIQNFGDVDANNDQLQFSNSVFATVAEVQAAMTQVGADVVITYDAANQITLQNVTLSLLDADDFRFV